MNGSQKSSALRQILEKKSIPNDAIETFLGYVNTEQRAEQSKSKKPVTDNNAVALADMLIRFYGVGVVIDGVNAVIAGRGMTLITFHGYKNKVLETYPNTKFDIQLVREGDEFSFSKESGKVIYTHKLNNPFANKPIIGAYVVIKNERGEFLELLNSRDYNEMKKKSRNAKTWSDWESEFWLKSVTKRACKRHFNDVVAAIDKVDNEDYGLRDTDDKQPPAEFDVKDAIKKATTRQALLDIFGRLSASEKQEHTDLFQERIREIQEEFSYAASNAS